MSAKPFLCVFVWIGAYGAQESFTIQMPIRLADAGDHFRLNSFGAHIGNHALDGHPGWDVEYRTGASALAAADGVVQSILADRQSGTNTLQIEHRQNGRAFRTIYTNLRDLGASIAPGAAVSAGQPIGVPAVQSFTVGTVPQTWASIHFQLDDFTVNHGLSNPSSVSPEAHLNAAGRAVFDAIWSGAAYGQEICEPFPSNSRNSGFPLTRTWTRERGGLAARIDFTCMRVQADSYRYTLFDDTGSVTETGIVELQSTGAEFTSLDLRPENGGIRRTVLKITSDTMLLDIGAPGGARPSGVNASLYRTTGYPLNVASSASYSAALAPEMIAAAFGQGLAVDTAVASQLPLPFTIASTRVMVRDSEGVQRDAAVYSVTPRQVNFIVPPGTSPGSATVLVTSGDGVVFTSKVMISRIAPGFFTANGTGSGVAAALVQRVRADGSQTLEPASMPIDLSRDGDLVFLNLFGTGIRGRSSLSSVHARAGGIDAPVIYAGAQSDSPGLDQINLLLPRTLAGRGDVEVVVTVDDVMANPVGIYVQ